MQKFPIFDAQFVELRFTAFSQLIFCGFADASGYARANLRRVYTVNKVDAEAEYDWMSEDEIRLKHPEMELVSEATQISAALG